MGPGGTISIPATSTIAEINSEIKKRVEDGTYNIGEHITPKQFSRLILKDDGTFLTESFLIEGRKIPLLDIRQECFTPKYLSICYVPKRLTLTHCLWRLLTHSYIILVSLMTRYVTVTKGNG